MEKYDFDNINNDLKYFGFSENEFESGNENLIIILEIEINEKNETIFTENQRNEFINKIKNQKLFLKKLFLMKLMKQFLIY